MQKIPRRDLKNSKKNPQKTIDNAIQMEYNDTWIILPVERNLFYENTGLRLL